MATFLQSSQNQKISGVIPSKSLTSRLVNSLRNSQIMDVIAGFLELNAVSLVVDRHEIKSMAFVDSYTSAINA